MQHRHSLLAAAALMLAACSDSSQPTEASSPSALNAAAVGASSARFVPGAVFTQSNEANGNHVIAFQRAADGTLRPAGRYPTGGLGTGRGLGSQGAVVLGGPRDRAEGQGQREGDSDGDERARPASLLFVVNAGSDDISVFAVARRGLRLVEREPSGGDMPISVTVHDGMLYVLNAGAPNNITGFTVARDGSLTPIPGSTRLLSGPMTGPAQVEFTPRGAFLVVTEKQTNLIDTYRVQRSGQTSGPVVNRSNGATPFGFAFDPKERLIVSEAFGGAPDASAMSSYELQPSGTLQLISGSVPTTETAACWVVVTKDGRFAYTTNTGSNSITAYFITREGGLVRRDDDGRTATTGSSPIDMALSRDGRFLYALNAGDGTISAYRVNPDGGLEPISGAGGLPPESVVGLAGR